MIVMQHATCNASSLHSYFVITVENFAFAATITKILSLVV